MSNGLYPGATLKLIPAGTNDPPIVPVGFAFHVAATNAFSLFGYFNGPSGGIESHFYIHKDGTIEQYRSCLVEADAQNAGNSWPAGGHRNGIISVETQGLGPGWWTNAQKDAIKKLILWGHQEFGIPLRKLTDPQPPTLAAGGIGYHSLFASWNTGHHNCPGPLRQLWFNRELVPWLALQGKPAVKPPAPVPAPVPPIKDLLNMNLTDKITIPANYPSNGTGKPEEVTVEVLLRRIYDWSYRAAFGDVPPTK